MARIAIIGAGISGPAAALALSKAGFTVDVYERRQESELHSFGVIGITNEKWGELTALGMDAHEYGHGYTVYGGDTTEWDGHHVEWTNLHNALVNAARAAGANFLFGTRYEAGQSEYDGYVIAAGVGYAGATSEPHYSGYVVYRGISDDQTDYDWLSVPDAAKRWNFKLARTDKGAAWELYSHLPKPRPMGTTTIDSISARAYEGLPEEFHHFILNSREMYRAAISDWYVPASLFRGPRTLSIGDANGAIRPHTGMGANLGISEALTSPAIFTGRTDTYSLTSERRYQHVRGVQIGRSALGS